MVTDANLKQSVRPQLAQNSPLPTSPVLSSAPEPLQHIFQACHHFCCPNTFVTHIFTSSAIM